MTDPRTCPHETTEPVYAYLHHANLKVGDTVLLVDGGRPVARICSDCLEQLPVGWGCPECDFEQVHVRELCEPQGTVVTILGRPCQEHA